MTVQSLSKSELMNRFGKLVQTERKITHLVLECIAEIDLRKIYLERAYPSLYEFLVKEFGYSPSSAIRRIESARLLRDVPEMSSKIEEGALNLSQLSKVQQTIRAIQKIEDRTMAVDEKRDLLHKIEYTTQNQTALILAQELSLPMVVEEHVKIHRDESVTLTVTFSREQIALLEQVQNMIAHNVPDGKWADVISFLAQKEIERRTVVKRTLTRKFAEYPELKSDQENVNSVGRSSEIKESSVMAVELGNVRKAVRPNLRKTILAKSKCCEFRDVITGRICGSQRFLQIDHIKPVWAGGNNEPDNLRVLCSQHNNFKYAQESGLHPLRVQGEV